MKKRSQENFKDRLIDLKEQEEEKIFNLSLRPKNLEEFVGQRKIVENLKIAIQASKKRGEPLEHILLSGPPGLGKTSLALVISKEMGTHLISTSGPAIEKAGDLVGILTNLEKGDILFIDEIHRLSKVAEEFLYPAMENFEIDFVVDKGPYAKTIKIPLKPFTLIGATTREGLLSSALRSRFGMFYHFDFYQPQDLKIIIMNSAQKMGLKVLEDAALEIACRSRGTPRVANRLLRRVRDYAQVHFEGEVTREVVLETFKKLGIDSLGLDDLDRKFLKTMIEIYRGGPVGIEAIAASLGEDVDTLQDVIEPYLLSIGFIRRSPRGREVCLKAYQHLNIKVPKGVQENFLFE